MDVQSFFICLTLAKHPEVGAHHEVVDERVEDLATDNLTVLMHAGVEDKENRQSCVGNRDLCLIDWGVVK